MDTVHHALIGGAGFLVAATHQQELAGAAFLAGSVFPLFSPLGLSSSSFAGCAARVFTCFGCAVS
jgi:hypothetical protein